jgi:hypothetical protein
MIDADTTNPKLNLIQVLQELEFSEFPFHLTGSHYFGTACMGSDVDLFAEDTEEISEFLISIGFKEEKKSKAINSNPKYHSRIQGVNRVFKHQCRVHVQLVEDANLKTEVQEIIRDRKLLANVQNKLDAKKIWDTVYETVKGRA